MGKPEHPGVVQVPEVPPDFDPPTLSVSQPTKQRPGDQPLPVANDLPHVADSLVEFVLARKRVGVERYGTALQPHNGRDALRDAFEESVDLATYLAQCLIERDGHL